MKESISNAVIFGIVLTFFAIIIGILAASSAYSKAFKVRNRIVEMIEFNQGYDDGIKDTSDFVDEIENELQKYGYRQNTSVTNNCEVRSATINGMITDIYAINTTSKYNYCIYKYTTDKGDYYGVTTYMYFDIPLVSELKLGLYGETKTLFDLSNF